MYPKIHRKLELPLTQQTRFRFYLLKPLAICLLTQSSLLPSLTESTYFLISCFINIENALTHVKTSVRPTVSSDTVSLLAISNALDSSNIQNITNLKYTRRERAETSWRPIWPNNSNRQRKCRQCSSPCCRILGASRTLCSKQPATTQPAKF